LKDWTDPIIEAVKKHHFLEMEQEEEVRAAARRANDYVPPNIMEITRAVEKWFYISDDLEKSIQEVFDKNLPTFLE
jgi:hydroxymethylpyrimidine/phosphomethylpyrimidine kinase